MSNKEPEPKSSLPEPKDWDPELYNRFRSYRAEPFRAILARLEIDPAEKLVDLGCGSGENTIELARRAARGRALGHRFVAGDDRAGNAAKNALPPELAARLEFRLGDIGAVQLAGSILAGFFQRRPALDRRPSARASGLLSCPAAARKAGRANARQLRGNRAGYADRLAGEPPWRDVAGRLGGPSQPRLDSPDHYTRLLKELGFVDIDCYYQVFAHPMNGPSDVVEWSRATVLRPFLDALAEGRREDFVAQWRRRLEQAYGTSGPLSFNFRRIFLWGRRRAS